jgi:hypothetical protein
VENLAVNGEAPTTVNSSVRTREYLTEAEIERLMAAARKSSRYGHRDAAMILIGYRARTAGFRAVRFAPTAPANATRNGPACGGCSAGGAPQFVAGQEKELRDRPWPARSVQ